MVRSTNLAMDIQWWHKAMDIKLVRNVWMQSTYMPDERLSGGFHCCFYCVTDKDQTNRSIIAILEVRNNVTNNRKCLINANVQMKSNKNYSYWPHCPDSWKVQRFHLILLSNCYKLDIRMKMSTASLQHLKLLKYQREWSNKWKLPSRHTMSGA